MINPTAKLTISETEEQKKKRIKKLNEIAEYLRKNGYQFEISKVECKTIELYTSGNVGI